MIILDFPSGSGNSLIRAHQDNDRAVWEAYGRAWPVSDESACMARLMTLYQRRIS